MLGCLWCQFCSGDLSLDSMLFSIHLCCPHRLYQTLWCYRRCSFWKAAFDFEHCTREQTSFNCVLARWLNAEVFVICPKHRGRFFVLNGASSWALRLTVRFLLAHSSLVFFYYSKFSFDEGYGHLIDFVAQFKFALLTFMSFLQPVSAGLLGIFKREFRIEPCVFYLVAMSSPVISFAETVGV